MTDTMREHESAQDFIRRKCRKFEGELERKKPLETKDIGRKGRQWWLREAWTFMPQHNLRNRKVFVVERLKKMRFDGRLADRSAFRKGAIEYRLGYYVVGRIGHTRGRWIWGQYCPLIPRRDFRKLIQKAEREDTIV